MGTTRLMEFGQIVIARNTKHWISKCIAYLTNSYWSHSFITAPPMCNRLMCVEAVSGGVSIMPFDIGYEEDPNEDFIVYEVLVTDDIKEKSINQILNDLEVGYGFLEYPWLIWRWVCMKFGKDIKSQDNWSNDGIICSELSEEYLKACGFSQLFKDFGVAAVTPEDLYKLVRANPQYFREVKRKLRVGVSLSE